MVEVWIFMLQNTMFASVMPAGNLSWAGSEREVLRRMLSSARCRFQKSPFRSLSFSSSLGRWRWVRFRPKRQAISTTPANGESVEAPSAVIASASESVRSGLLLLNASSVAGKFVRIWM